MEYRKQQHKNKWRYEMILFDLLYTLEFVIKMEMRIFCICLNQELMRKIKL